MPRVTGPGGCLAPVARCRFARAARSDSVSDTTSPSRRRGHLRGKRRTKRAGLRSILVLVESLLLGDSGCQVDLAVRGRLAVLLRHALCDEPQDWRRHNNFDAARGQGFGESRSRDKARARGTTNRVAKGRSIALLSLARSVIFRSLFICGSRSRLRSQFGLFGARLSSGSCVASLCTTSAVPTSSCDGKIGKGERSLCWHVWFASRHIKIPPHSESLAWLRRGPAATRTAAHSYEI